MAAPEYVPGSPLEKVRAYGSPDYVPEPWLPDRPAEVVGLPQPEGGRFGNQGPDQGYALRVARAVFQPQLKLAPGEDVDDAIAGCVGIALRRASLYGRAPTAHDLRLAFTIWGFLDPSPPADLVELRRKVFEGVANPHHYAEARAIANAVPEATLRMTPAEAAAAYPARWHELIVA